MNLRNLTRAVRCLPARPLFLKADTPALLTFFLYPERLTMHRVLGAALALALFAGCTARQTATNSTALISAEAVASDLVALEQEIQASSATVTPAELAALANAMAAAQEGVTALTENNAQASTVFASITTALQEVEPFLPEIAAVIGVLAAPPPSAAAPATPVFPAIAKLQTDMAALHAAA